MEIANVLDEDPDLGRMLAEPRLSAARRDCRAPLFELPAGAWDAEAALSSTQRGYGLLVLDGVLARRVGRTRRHGVELLGPGDVLRPEDAEAANATLSFPVAWRAVEPARLAILDTGFVRRSAPYPEVGARLVGRATARARGVLVHLAIAQHARIDTRLWLALWHLADRFGRVTPDGVLLPLRLTHELLADLIAAQRPSVTLSLQQLEQQGRLERSSGSILLLGEPPADNEHSAAAAPNHVLADA
jgi:CRP-like cAMP-binding protein